MILWQDISRSERIAPPPWLLDVDGQWCADLQSRECRDGRLWGIGDHRLIAAREGRWVALDDGWRALLLPDFDPLSLARRLPWCPVTDVPDAHGRAWSIANPLTQSGESRIIGTYDEQWNRVLTDEQGLLERMALAARRGLCALQDETQSDLASEGATVAQVCAWAAGAICAATHISPQALARLGLFDEHLAKAASIGLAGMLPEPE